MHLGRSIDATSTEVSVSSHSQITGTDTGCHDNTFHSATQSLASTPQQGVVTLETVVDSTNEDNFSSNIGTHNHPTETITDTTETSAVSNEPNTKDVNAMSAPPPTIPPINLTQERTGNNERLPIQIIDHCSQE